MTTASARRRRGAPDMARFSGVAIPSSDYQATNDGLKIPYMVLELDLSTARSLAAGTERDIQLEGNALYVDQAPDVGACTVILQGQSKLAPPGRIYVQPGSNFQIPFTRIIVENLAQPGKVLRMFYGTDIDFKPGTTGQVVISGTTIISTGVAGQLAGIVQTQEQAAPYGVSFQSSAVVVVATPQNIWAAGTNVAGIRLWAAKQISANVTIETTGALLAKATAPTTVLDGDVIFSSQFYYLNGTLRLATGSLLLPVRIAAGKRGDFMVATTDTISFINCARYDIL